MSDSDAGTGLEPSTMISEQTRAESATAEVFRVERWKEYPRGQEPACADCGTYRDLIGPVSHDGDVYEGGDMVCPGCAEARGLELTYCTCGTASPSDIACPECSDYLGYRSTTAGEVTDP